MSNPLHTIHLHTIHRYSQTTTKPLFHEKIWIFVKHSENVSTYYSSSSAVFASNMWIRSEQQIMPLCFVQRQLCRASRTQNKKVLRETLAKTLYPLFMFHSIFISSYIFCGCSRILCSGLQKSAIGYPVCKMKQHCDSCTYVGRYYSTATL